MSANPGIPALCLQLLSEGAIAAGAKSTSCGPGNENLVFVAPDGTTTAGTRGPFSAPYRNTPVNGSFIVPFGNDSYFITAGYSSYNSAQVNWKHSSQRTQILLGYTFSKSLDNSSGYGEQFNPINPRLSRGLSAFDSTQNFVVSYSLHVAIRQIERAKETYEWLANQRNHPLCHRASRDHPRNRRPFAARNTGFGGPITLPVDTPNLLGSVQTIRTRGIMLFTPFLLPHLLRPVQLRPRRHCKPAILPRTRY